MKKFVIAGTGSGSGKTTLTLAILAYLSKLGYKAAPFKVGPDFIDPGHHTALTGTISRNLDSWMLSKRTNQQIFTTACSSINADIAVVEGVMGLFDGYSGISEDGSTAQMAKWLKLPILLVLDSRSMARSAAAIIKGFEDFDPELQFLGVVFSKTGSERHYNYLKEAVEANCRMKVIGHIPRNNEIAMPERHLGLVTSDEHTIPLDIVDKLVNMLDKHTLIKEMVENLIDEQVIVPQDSVIRNLDSWMLSNDSTEFDPKSDLNMLCSLQKENIKIAVARDKAFCFYYQENIEALKKHGAEIVEFSPINSKSLPDNIHGIYFGGGYPELFAQELASNTNLLSEIKEKCLKGMPIYGECGGFMYLCKEIIWADEYINRFNKETHNNNIETHNNNIENNKTFEHLKIDNKKYTMTGCFPFSSIMSKKMRSLGYRQITLNQDTIIGKKGDILKGHEFHYSSIDDKDIKAVFNMNGGNIAGNEHNIGRISSVYDTSDRNGQNISLNGYQFKNTLGSYLHIHFESMEGKAGKSFVEACKIFNESSS